MTDTDLPDGYDEPLEHARALLDRFGGAKAEVLRLGADGQPKELVIVVRGRDQIRQALVAVEGIGEDRVIVAKEPLTP